MYSELLMITKNSNIVMSYLLIFPLLYCFLTTSVLFVFYVNQITFLLIFFPSLLVTGLAAFLKFFLSKGRRGKEKLLEQDHNFLSQTWRLKQYATISLLLTMFLFCRGTESNWKVLWVLLPFPVLGVTWLSPLIFHSYPAHFMYQSQ